MLIAHLLQIAYTRVVQHSGYQQSGLHYNNADKSGGIDLLTECSDFKDAYDICLMFTDKPFNVSNSSALANNGKPVGSVFPKLPRNASWTSQNKAGVNYNLQAVGGQATALPPLQPVCA